MCGIAGMVLREALDPSYSADIVQEMISALAHRGPDDSGLWTDSERRVVLGHRRLSIIDLSPSGHQPMVSSDGRYAITYNGELYNFKTLREQLTRLDGGLIWRSESDTEVMLEAFRIWGLQEALHKFVGMFAFALWDCAHQTLYLARDRLGEKPLYYGWLGSAFYFASELKALQRVPHWEANLDKDSVGLYFRYGFVPAPHSIYKNINKLEPGSYLTLSAAAVRSRETPMRTPYWEIPTSVSRLLVPYLKHEHEDLATALERLLIQSVSRQLVADVPVGAFLSGGVDSSSVVAIAQELCSHRIQTYTVSFHEEAYSEGRYARAVAHHLGTDHTELYVTAGDAIDVVQELPKIYDEPMSDPSQIPTFLVSKLASRYVKVCLSGDGGDEMFGGYNRHVWGARLPRSLSWLRPDQRKRLVALVLNRWGAGGRSAMGRVQKLADAMVATDAQESYLALITHWKREDRLLVSEGETEPVPPPWDTSVDPRRAMMRADASWYLPDDILVKLDRASMAVGLETRVPFLDHDLVEFASQIPIEANIGLATGKKLLREILHRRVPPRLVDRPKMGFGLPIDQWLRGPLRNWAEHLISPRQLAQHGLLHKSAIEEKWRQHLSGVRDWSTPLWNVLTFQAWYEEYVQ